MLTSTQTVLVVVVLTLGTLTTAMDSLARTQTSHTASNLHLMEESESLPETPVAESPDVSISNGQLITHNLSTNYSPSGTENSVLGSLFTIGLTEIEKDAQMSGISGTESEKQDASDSSATNPEMQETNESYSDLSLSKIFQNLNNVPIFPLVPKEDTLAFEEIEEADKSPFLKYLDGIRKDAWTQFKTMAVGYIEFLEDQYEVQDATERLPLDLIRNVLDFGDKVNFLHALGKRVDPGFVGYLRKQLEPLFSYFENLTGGRVLGYNPSAIISSVVNDVAWQTIHHFADHVLKITRNIIDTEELEEYEKELAKSLPIAAMGLRVFLNGPPKSRDLARRTREQRQLFDSYGNGYDSSGFSDGYGRPGFRNSFSRNGYSDNYGIDSYGNGYKRDDISDAYYGASYKDGYVGYGTGSNVGYGGYGAYDDYGMSNYHKYLDPYLVLAGIGAAVLLAWLGYKLLWAISSSKAGRRRRDTDDDSFLDYSDIADEVFSVHKLLEDAVTKYEKNDNVLEDEQPKYERNASNTSRLDEWDDLIRGVNSLWKESKLENGCLKCSFFNIVIENHLTTPWNLAKQIVLSGVMQLLGSEGSGQLMDEVTNQVLAGRPATCERRGNTCDLQ